MDTYDFWFNNFEEEKEKQKPCECNVEYIVSRDKFSVCPECGTVSDKQPFENSYVFLDGVNIYKGYKRIDHFMEYVKNLQGLIPIEIPDDIRQKICNECNNDPKYLRLALRRLKLTKYVEKVPYIQFKLFNIDSPTLKHYMLDELITIFKQVSFCYNKFKPSTRKNFLSYNYVVFKLFEMIELPIEYFVNIQFIQNEKKLREFDSVWALICNQLELPFIASI